MPSQAQIETATAAAVTRSEHYGKSQVVDDVPKVIKELHFGVISNRDLINQSQVELADRRIYDFDQGDGRKIALYGPLDQRMGVSGKHDECATCKQPLQTCNGHFGHVRLILPVFHVGYFKKTVQILQSICKDCSCLLLSEVDRRKFLNSFRRANGDTLRQAVVVRRVAEQARKTKACFECGAINGLVRKAGTASLKISHDKFKTYNSSTSTKKIPPPSKVAFDESFTVAKKNISELEKHLKRAMDDLNPLRTLNLFKQIRECDLELLGVGKARPESFLWRYIPAPPVAIRPSVGQEGATTEDDITTKLGDIIFANQSLKEALDKGAPVQSIVEHWDFLSLQLAMFVNSDVPGLAKGEGKPIRGLVQRLKGKQGRFRGNLSGKRVDFSGRTVISPDPNLRIDEVAVPVLVAKNMTYPEVVTHYNIKKLRQRVRNGTKTWPGANYVVKADGGFRLFLRFGTPDRIADALQEGDIVERHLEDGDIVLFNRQPSLHKLSILCHHVKVRPHRTFRLNECVCNPYNADFDGDEMNLHVPQTEEARTEALQLMGVKYNLTTPKNGEPIIAAIQDFITACWMLSSLDVFYDKKNFVTICMGMLEPDMDMELPPPSIIKPEALWTGKQVFNVLIRPNKQQNIRVNLDAPSRDHKPYHEGLHRDLQDDSFLCIRNSEVMCGRMDKGTVGSGQKKSLFYTLVRDYGPDAAAKSMNRLSKLCARWLANQGFSVGISDVTPPQMIVDAKDELIDKVFAEYDQMVLDSKGGKLTRKSGMDDAGTLESEQNRVLSTVRTKLATVLQQQLSRKNSPMLMATSGSKGSNLNVAQMAALLGQQDIEGKRVPETFQHRTLPHFAKYERSPSSLGFVYNSFFSGLTPYEFIFHGMGGRVGLVDTAVKTAETGYMSRRLMKSLEDLSTQYDRTVRNSASNIVQFRFGDDELDPVDMEASAQPVDFDRTFAHVEATTFNMQDVGLSDGEIHETMENILSPERGMYPRLDLTGNILTYDTDDERYVDQNESARAYLKSIQDFIANKSKQFNEAKERKAQFALPDPRSATSHTTKRLREEDNEDDNTSSRARRTSRRSAATTATSSKKRKVKDVSDLVPAKVRAGPSTKDRFDLTSKLSKTTLETFIHTCIEKYKRARVEPAHAVGAVGAQSIGEPGTQMTLKTFHFAGVAGMNLTAGVPRIKEIINASKDISTPVITCRLERRRDLSIPASLAQIVKGRIERLYLRDITTQIQMDYPPERASCLEIKISLDTISDLGLDLTMVNICDAIMKHRKLKGTTLKLTLRSKDEIELSADGIIKSSKRGGSTGSKGEENSRDQQLLLLQSIQRLLPTIHILGHPTASRCVITAEDDPMAEEIRQKRLQVSNSKPQTKEERVVTDKASDSKAGKSKAKAETEPAIKLEAPTASTTAPAVLSASAPANAHKPIQMHKVMVEGYGLRFCMNTDGVDPYHTQTNSVIETFQVLGIEAARSKIITEIAQVMASLSVDPRHMALLADVMTYKGEVLGITRFGLAKMRDSVLQLASFEKTADHVFDAGIAGKVDAIEGVSECVIVGKTMGLGTGMVEVVRNLGVSGAVRTAVFEQAWKDTHAVHR